MTANGLLTVAPLLGREIGLRLDAAMTARLGSCLRDMAQERDSSVGSVTAQIRRDPHARQQLIDRITVQESWFFRDPAQLDALARLVLPLLPRPVRIWVAGCANGQEAYSISMLLSEAGHHDAQVIATDVSASALDRTRLGSYHERELRGLSAERRARFLRPRGDRFVVTDELRQRLVVQRQNLAGDPLPLPAGTASVVFCRNVLIYFRPAVVPGVVHRVASALTSGGLLFSGVAEAHWQVGVHFELIRLGDAFVYRLGAKQQQRTGPSSVAGPTSSRRRKRQRPVAITPEVGPAVVGPEVGHEHSPGPDLVAVALLHAGEQAAAAGDHPRAIILFRQAGYLDRSLSMAHLQLGIALESVGDHVAAARAYGAAQQSLGLDGAGIDTVPGYSTDALRRHLDFKLAGRQT